MPQASQQIYQLDREVIEREGLTVIACLRDGCDGVLALQSKDGQTLYTGSDGQQRGRVKLYCGKCGKARTWRRLKTKTLDKF